MNKRIVYIGWVGFGNLGDDMCYELFLQHAEQCAATMGFDIEVTPLFPLRLTPANFLNLNPDLVVLGAGSVLESPYLEALILAQKQNVPTMIWGSGVDNLLPPATHTFGASGSIEKQLKLIVHYSGYAGASLLQGVNHAVLGGVRGPDTWMLLQQLGCNLSRMTISGDPGLLLSDDVRESSPENAISPRIHPTASSDDGRPVVGVNWGTTRNKLYGGDEAATRERLAQALNAMGHRFRYVLFAMWDHDLPELQRLASSIDERHQIIHWKEVPSPAQLTGMLQQCLFTINLKLHANVFSAAMGCPFISVAYRVKCFDFAHSLGCHSFVMTADDPDLIDKIQALSDLLYEENNRWRGPIMARRDAYVKQLHTLLQAGLSVVSETAGNLEG